MRLHHATVTPWSLREVHLARGSSHEKITCHKLVMGGPDSSHLDTIPRLASTQVRPPMPTRLSAMVDSVAPLILSMIRIMSPTGQGTVWGPSPRV